MYSVQNLESKFYYPEDVKCQDYRYLKKCMPKNLSWKLFEVKQHKYKLVLGWVTMAK